MTWWQSLIVVVLVGALYLVVTRNWPRPPRDR